MMNKKVRRAKEILRSGGTVTLNEPCDCGDKVRHNNGGNYHQIIKLKIRKGRTWAQYSDTCEMTPPEEWREADESLIDEHADWM